jgi:secreted trypsin-like serine protease
MPTLRTILPAIAIAGALSIPSTASAVVGGQDATRAYPHMAELRSGGQYICGASLVGANKILTAAHCVVDDKSKPSNLTFVLGRTTRSNTSQGEVIGASAVEVHPQYDPDTMSYDVAIVTLSRNATKGTPIRVVSTSERSLWAAGKTATVTGWGARVGFDLAGITVTDRLQEVDLPIVSDADCDESYQPLYGGIDESTMVCAGELYGTKDSCQGDSGGPLVVPDANGTLVQAGVVSWGFGCGYPTQYGIYSRIGDTALNGWIQQRVGGSTTTTSTTTTKPRKR